MAQYGQMFLSTKIDYINGTRQQNLLTDFVVTETRLIRRTNVALLHSLGRGWFLCIWTWCALLKTYARASNWNAISHRIDKWLNCSASSSQCLQSTGFIPLSYKSELLRTTYDVMWCTGQMTTRRYSVKKGAAGGDQPSCLDVKGFFLA